MIIYQEIDSSEEIKRVERATYSLNEQFSREILRRYLQDIKLTLQIGLVFSGLLF